MINLTHDLSFFYQKYSEEFIRRHFNQDQNYYLIVENEKTVGQFVVYQDSQFMDTLFFGLMSIEIFNQETAIQFQSIIGHELEKRGLKKIVGPIDFNIWYSNRVKADSDLQFWWEPSMLGKTKKFLEASGLEVDKTYVTHFFEDFSPLREVCYRSFEHATDEGFQFRLFTPNLKNELNICHLLNCTAFQDSYFYKDISLEDYRDFIFNPLLKIDLSYSYFVLNREGKEVGYTFNILDNYKGIKMAVLKSILLLPEYQGYGLSSAMIYFGATRFINAGISLGAGALVREGAKSEKLFSKMTDESMKSHYYYLYSFCKK